MAYRSLICKVFSFFHNKNNCELEGIDDGDGSGYGVRKKQHGKLQSDKMYFIAWFSSINSKMTNELKILSERMHVFECAFTKVNKLAKHEKKSIE